MKKAILCFPFVHSRQPQYPIGLYKIASHCKNYYDVIVLDQRLQHNVKEIISSLLENSDVLCLGLSVLTGEQILSAIDISKTFHGKVKIVWGGMHPTILPKQTIQEEFVDFVIRGEGEEAFLNLLLYLDHKEIPAERFLSKENSNYIYNIIPDLNEIDLDFTKYPVDNAYFVKRDGFKRAFNIETSRGCPHRCYYCHNSVYKTPYRYLSCEKIVQTIDFLIRHYDVDGIIFQEDNLFASPRHVRCVVSALQRRKNVGWKANSRIDYFKKYVYDKVFMGMLVRSGCKVLQFGIESGSERIQKLINKRLKISDVIEVNRELAKYPIRIRYNFIVGFPTETIEEMKLTFDLINKLREDNPNMDPPFLNIYTPYPGTPLFEEALKHGLKPPSNTAGWSKFTWNSVSVPWLADDVRELLEKMSREFFDASLYLKE